MCDMKDMVNDDFDYDNETHCPECGEEWEDCECDI